MKEQELRKHATCSLCQKKIGHTGVPLFWVVRIERFGLKLSAIQRQDGLAAMLGGSARLAQVMGTDAEMAVSVSSPMTLTVCEDCAVEKKIVIAAVVDSADLIATSTDANEL